MIIRFKNWEKFNTRSGGIKKPWWFAFDHDLFYHTGLYDLDPDELLTMIYLLCEASKNTPRGEVFVSPEHYVRHIRVHSREPLNVLNRCIQKLKRLQIIEQPRVRGKYVECTAHYNTLQDNTLHNINTILPDSAKAEPRRVFDFNALYNKYPRKEGKSRGLALCRLQIKTQKDYDELSLAIDRYNAHLRKMNTEPAYYKYFSTFMSSWRDWLDPETGKIEAQKGSKINWDEVFSQKVGES